MATGIANYSQLQTAILDAMGRVGDPIAVAKAPRWIGLYESRANRELRLRAMETRVAFDITAEFMALPTDFLEARNIQLNTSPVTSLELSAPEYIDRLRIVGTGTPKRFAILANSFQFSPPPSGTTAAELTYWAAIPELSGLSSSNLLLTSAPHLYLFGSLVEAWTDLDDDAEIAKYEARYQVAVRAVQDADDRGKWSGATPVSRVPGLIFSDNRSRVRG